jgi:hypothetical protein
MTSENHTPKDQATKDAESAASQESQSTPQLPPDGIVPPAEIPPAPHSYQITCKTEKDWRDKAKFWAELVGLAFLILYTLFTAAIYCANQRAAEAAQNTLGEIQKQTKLIRQQLVGTLGAVVSISDPVSPSALGNNINISFGFRNYGHVNANKFRFAVKIQVLSLADQKLIGKQWSCDHEFAVITPTSEHTPTPSEHVFIQCFIAGLTNEDLKAIRELNRTIAIDGTYTYENGFDEIKEESICLRYVPQVQTNRGLEGGNTFDTCDVFPKERDYLLNGMAAKKH